MKYLIIMKVKLETFISSLAVTVTVSITMLTGIFVLTLSLQ